MMTISEKLVELQRLAFDIEEAAKAASETATTGPVKRFFAQLSEEASLPRYTKSGAGFEYVIIRAKAFETRLLDGE